MRDKTQDPNRRKIPPQHTNWVNSNRTVSFFPSVPVCKFTQCPTQTWGRHFNKSVARTAGILHPQALACQSLLHYPSSHCSYVGSKRKHKAGEQRQLGKTGRGSGTGLCTQVDRCLSLHLFSFRALTCVTIVTHRTWKQNCRCESLSVFLFLFLFLQFKC